MVIYFIFSFTLILIAAGCGDDDDDDDNDPSPDDDDDTAADDDDDDDVVPTTLDVTIIPVESGETWVLGEGPGEPHEVRNDLGVVPSRGAGDPLSMLYFISLTDLHQTDEESPTRLTFFDSMVILDGAFEAAFRPQEDLAPHMSNALVRTINRIQVDYDRDLDLALLLGDNTDNAQDNEMKTLIDILDGSGVSSGMEGWVRSDSGDLNIDPDSGLDLGARDFDIQEVDDQGENIDAFNRPGYPNSNADFATGGLVKSDGSPVPWFSAIGNHDAYNTGNFDPNGPLTFFSTDDYLGDVAHYGFIPGLGATIQYWQNHPLQQFHIDGGVFGLDLEWGLILGVFDLLGMIPDDYSSDVDPRFDLMTLLHDTPMESADDGVAVVPDVGRTFLGTPGTVSLLHQQGHGFVDNNNDSVVDASDGGYYRLEMSQIDPGNQMPLRFLVLNSMDKPTLASGGIGQAQFNWLQSELDQAVADKVLVVVANHHYPDAMATGGPQLVQMFNSCPNVILHLVGHGHYNVIEPRISPDLVPAKGYWEVQTPSGVEFPQQSRIIEIVDNRDGTGSVYLTLFDFQSIEGDDPDELAELGRELSFGDTLRGGYSAGHSFGGMGSVSDRNRELLFAIPDDVQQVLATIDNGLPITSVESLGQKYQTAGLDLVELPEQKSGWESRKDENGMANFIRDFFDTLKNLGE